MNSLWDRFRENFLRYDDCAFTLDISRMRFEASLFEKMRADIERAFTEMRELESGAIANPDEQRMVGHYWLRAPRLAPTPEMRAEIEQTRQSIEQFARAIHSDEITAPGGKKFTELLIVGIGGSALGPQFIADALSGLDDPMAIHFLDNTDPDGIARTLGHLTQQLGQTLVLVISKSGGTKETRNGMLETAARYEAASLDFSKHAVAITGDGSELHKVAHDAAWLKTFPMWDWVGGRTSVMSAVGLAPMALQGFDIGAFLDGAAAMDEHTRQPDARANAAMLLALMWHHAGDGRGAKDMVILPYADRLALFSKYLQQLVMESLGKERDLDGQIVNQGIAVYGNKGSTDQHAYVQQLREGVANFFATFIEVRRSQAGEPLEVEPGTMTGDYLQGFLRGTRTALYENGRDSITLSIKTVDARTIGALIALYERAVGFYASLVRINAYHQPGVEAGKKAATRILTLQGRVISALEKANTEPQTAPQIAQSLGADPEDTFHVLTHLAANRESIIAEIKPDPAASTFTLR